MKTTLQALAQHLRARRTDIVRTEKVRAGEYDPTYGLPTVAEFEVVDFDRLLDEIDAFAETFN